MFKKNFFLLIVLTIIFSLIIFYIKMYFFSWIEKSIEEEYIDRSLFISLESSKKEENEEIAMIKKNEASTGIILKENSTKKIINYKFTYIPRDFKDDSILQTNILKKIIVSSPFQELIFNLWIDIYKNTFDVRWKMKNWKVKLFWVRDIKNPELVSVFIHEVAHFIDIYYLNRDNYEEKDYSYYFYDIAWDSTKTIKSSVKSYDFVSWYAMTNKYEDFAETFTYYVLHNEDFAHKALASEILKKKYDFFNKYLFKNGEFISVNFWNGDEIKEYYWDITKIDINLEKFLQYFKNTI